VSDITADDLLDFMRLDGVSKVEDDGTSITLFGRTPTYYRKQVAQERAMKIINGRRKLVNKIEVQKERE